MDKYGVDKQENKKDIEELLKQRVKEAEILRDIQHESDEEEKSDDKRDN